MLTDQQSNYVYVADSLPLKYANFFEEFKQVLNSQNIPLDLIPGTKDIWAVDYMPIQVRKDKFVQFVYNPDYLRSTQKWKKTISDVDAICREMAIPYVKSDIVLDGGNVVRWEDKVILCNKVFVENPHYSSIQLIKALKELLEVDKVIFVPLDPHDEIGHADGMVRFLDSDTVLINNYSKEKRFQIDVKTPLYNAGLELIELPYNPYNNSSDLSAVGIYINYLQTGGHIIVPTYSMPEDEIALRQLEQLFPGSTIKPLSSTAVAQKGGVLNCITWNVLA